jgi:pimeloyl-ACP methyl ester carboxylesterase
MPIVTANNCDMYYEVDDYTDPWVTEKETVWLQHGVGRSTKFWYHWVPALARHYRVVRRDMRGHGQSADPGPNHTWSIDELILSRGHQIYPIEISQVSSRSAEAERAKGNLEYAIFPQ